MELRIGLQVFHNGSPVQLIYQVSPHFWKVQPLFIRAEERVEYFSPYEVYKELHTSRESVRWGRPPPR